jgi:DNA-binding LacI/PurR family transcriptional regulator
MATVSIKDVAARAGVSLGTVSNVLNRPAAVRPAIRAQVEAAFAELVLDATNPFFTDVARGVEDVANIEFAAAAAVPLTSVSQPRHLLGQTAARLLAEEADRGTEHVHQHVVFPPELIARASTSASSARRPA